VNPLACLKWGFDDQGDKPVGRVGPCRLRIPFQLGLHNTIDIKPRFAPEFDTVVHLQRIREKI